jgi:hypothetical protein
LIYKGFKIGGVEMPGKVSGIATFYNPTIRKNNLFRLKCPEK